MVVTAIVAGSALTAGAAVAGGAIAAQGAENAANTQANAATQNQNNLLAMGQEASGMDINAINPSLSYLKPYQNLGVSASGLLQKGLENGSLTAPFNPTMSELKSLPGYQFELQQGLEATQNGFAARGLGSSGAALKGAAEYAQGLAANDLNNYANIYWANQNNTYNRLMGATQVGQGAGADMAQTRANLTEAGSNALMGAATNATSLGMAGAAASAAGTVGAANAISNGLTGSMNSLSNGALAYGVLGTLNGGNSLSTMAQFNSYPALANTGEYSNPLTVPTYSFTGGF